MFLRIEGAIVTREPNYGLLNWNIPTSMKKKTNSLLFYLLIKQHEQLNLSKSKETEAQKKANCQVMKPTITTFIKRVITKGAITYLR